MHEDLHASTPRRPVAVLLLLVVLACASSLGVAGAHGEGVEMVTCVIVDARCLDIDHDADTVRQALGALVEPSGVQHALEPVSESHRTRLAFGATVDPAGVVAT